MKRMLNLIIRAVIAAWMVITKRKMTNTNCIEQHQESDLLINVRKRNVGRFKAGAELSGKVNIMAVDFDHDHDGEEENLELKIQNASHGTPEVQDPCELDDPNGISVKDPKRNDFHFNMRRAASVVDCDGSPSQLDKVHVDITEDGGEDHELIEFKVQLRFRKIESCND